MKMYDNSSDISENSSSQYFDVCSNSMELYELEKKNNSNKQEKSEESSKKNSSMKEDSKVNYESPPKKSLNNINNTFNSTGIFSSNRTSTIKNLIKSKKESIDEGTEKTLQKKSFKNKLNVISLNSVKKKLLSPIDEKANAINMDSSMKSLNSKDNLNNDSNYINDDSENNINKNININIIINKKKKQINNNKFIYNNTNINNMNINNTNSDTSENNSKYIIKRNKINSKKNINNINISSDNNKKVIEEINTDINDNKINFPTEDSIYSSLDEISNTTIIRKRNKKQRKRNQDKGNNNNNGTSLSESNPDKKSINENSISISMKSDSINMEISNEDNVNFRDYNSFMINSINFEDIPQDKLTVNDLKVNYNLREITVKKKDVSEKDRFIKTLLELQIFNFDNSPIWVMKISKHGKYLAAGNKLGKIRIYEIMGYDYDKYQNEYNKKNIINFLHFVDEKAIKEFTEHKKDITDLCWSPFRKDLLLSASIDHFVILWDISKEENCLIEKYEHNDFVTCVQFSPVNEKLFVTGSFDKFVRVYNISNYLNKKNKKNDNLENDENNEKKGEKKVIKENVQNFSAKKIKDFFNLTDKITSISFFPDGNQIAIGTINGKINIYDILYQQIRYNHSFTCRNRVGKNSLGKKITSINFINKTNAIITSSDSCIRLFSMDEGKNISKYKGYENEKSMIRASVDLNNDVIISGSENGFCYIWHIFNKVNNERKNYYYEYFQPFSRDIVECSIIIDEKCYVNYIKKVLKLTNKINVISVIINSTDNGKIEVLLNICEDFN